MSASKVVRMIAKLPKEKRTNAMYRMINDLFQNKPIKESDYNQVASRLISQGEKVPKFNDVSKTATEGRDALLKTQKGGVRQGSQMISPETKVPYQFQNTYDVSVPKKGIIQDTASQINPFEDINKAVQGVDKYVKRPIFNKIGELIGIKQPGVDVSGEDIVKPGIEHIMIPQVNPKAKETAEQIAPVVGEAVEQVADPLNVVPGGKLGRFSKLFRGF